VGQGTERIELEVRRLFPQARILRIDGDTVRRPKDARRLWEQLYSGAFDVVIGTQILFQRAPLASVGLVGIVLADAGLHMPDFRAAERTYQLLVDAVSMARWSADGGRVVVQTMLPTHHAIEAVVRGEPSRFYEEELAARRLLGYPPARHLVSLSVSGRQAEIVEAAAKQWRARLEQIGGEHLMILGPVRALGGRPAGHHRQHMIVKGTDRTEQCEAIRRSVERMEQQYRKTQAKFVVDVDPVDMG
jgi:primosomal protein N' (replication factor Y)